MENTKVKTMITAKELFDKMLSENDECTSTEMMVEFAKLHVIEALKQASEKANLINVTFCGRSKSQIHKGSAFKYHNDDFVEINTKGILNAYSLDNVV